MAKAARPSQIPTQFDNGETVGENAQVAWQGVWCCAHHHETLERRLTRCPYGCPPGPQIRMLQTAALETLGGGSRGGMKTETGRGILLKGNLDLPWEHEVDAKGQLKHIIHGSGLNAYCGLCVNNSYISHPRYRALILRENEKDLADWLSRAYALYTPMGANVTEKPARVVWPHPFAAGSPGAIFVLGHMRDSNAFSDYQGQEFHRMLFEELTQIENELLYLQIIGSCRSTFTCRRNCKPGTCTCGILRRQVFNTANPGGPGHLWVKKRFVSVGKPNEVYTDPLTKQTRIYIPSLVTDNPYLMQDEGYLAWLEALPEPTRSAWRFGDWNALGGQYFRDFRPLGPLQGEPPEARHVIPKGSRPLQPWWPRWIGGDWGYGHGFAIYGSCQDPNGQIIVYKELCGKEIGALELGDMIGRAFLPDFDAMSKVNESPSMNFWLSPDAFDKRDAVLTIAETIGAGIQRVLGPGSVHFPDLRNQPLTEAEKWDDRRFEEIEIQQKAGISIRRAQNSRVAGWQYMRELLRFKQIAQPNKENYNAEYHAKLIMDNSQRAIEYVRSFDLRKPEILPKVLFCDDCTGIIEAIPTLIYDEGTEDVLKTHGPEDQAADGCLVAGTMVRTSVGDLPIETIGLGDTVLTRTGFQRVLSAGLTRESAPTVNVLLSNGKVLSGTGNHPVFVEDNGFLPLDALRYGDTLLPCPNPKWSSSMASPIAAIRNPRIGDISGPLPESRLQGRFTSQFGRRFMDRSRMGATSTIRTTIPSTTTSITWNASLRRSTPIDILLKNVASAVASTLAAFARWPQLGMEVRLGGNGTLSMGSGSPPILSPSKSGATSATRNTQQKSRGTPDSAPMPASQRSDGPTEKMWRRGFVSSASRLLNAVASVIGFAVPVRVVAITSGEPAPVYNLSVENTPEYFANGVLVHNCRYNLHSQNQHKGREPKQLFTQRHMERYSQPGVSLSYQDKVWMSLAASEEYAKGDEQMRPFSVRPDSSGRRFQ